MKIKADQGYLTRSGLRALVYWQVLTPDDEGHYQYHVADERGFRWEADDDGLPCFNPNGDRSLDLMAETSFGGRLKDDRPPKRPAQVPPELRRGRKRK